jgi:hypothetical protein
MNLIAVKIEEMLACTVSKTHISMQSSADHVRLAAQDHRKVLRLLHAQHCFRALGSTCPMTCDSAVSSTVRCQHRESGLHFHF